MMVTALITRKGDKEMSVFEKVRSMNKDEFTEFCLMIYRKAWHDGVELVDDDTWIYHRLADFDYEQFLDEFE